MTPVGPSFRSRAWAVPARADGRWGEDGHEAAGGDVELGVESSLETGGWWTHGLPPNRKRVFMAGMRRRDASAPTPPSALRGGASR